MDLNRRGLVRLIADVDQRMASGRELLATLEEESAEYAQTIMQLLELEVVRFDAELALRRTDEDSDQD